MSNTRIIHKYSNRRLYDPQASRHLTVLNIAYLISEDEEVSVLNKNSGQDVTREVLFHLLGQCEALSATPQLPPAQLARLIKAAFPNLPKGAIRAGSQGKRAQQRQARKLTGRT
jgi:polyhydroxyalkanoate synthesis repressor PhaR